MNTVSTKDMQILLKEISHLLLEENHLLRDSMQRIDSLLKHAVELLNESVFSVNTTIQTHQNTLKTAVEAREDHKPVKPGDDLLNSLRQALGITIQLNTILSKTTRSLQVEDIVSQIVHHVTNRTLALDEAMQELQTLSEESNWGLTEDSFKRTLKQIETLRTNSLNNPIKQSSLDEGDIELF